MALIIEELCEEIPVFDITVEDNHNFFANNILVHNCQEIALPTKPIQHIDDTEGRIATCILSAINLGKIDNLDDIEPIADLAVRFLDVLIDYQDYPIKAAEHYTKEYRTLGIGYIGLAHYLAKNKVAYGNPKAWTLMHDTTEAFAYYLTKASVNLAKEKGPAKMWSHTRYADGLFPKDLYKKSVDQIAPNDLKYDWDGLKKEMLTYGMRNCTLMAQMPAESSAVVSNATNGIEPPRDYLSIKKSKKTPLKQIVPQYHRLKNEYDLAWDMPDNVGYINIVAVMQKFFDQSISANIYYNPEKFPKREVPLSLMLRDLLYCYKNGVKNLYYQNSKDGKGQEEEPLQKSEVDNTTDDEVCEACSI